MEEGNMKTKKISTIFLGIALAMLAITSKVTSGPPKPKVDTPIISCAGSTEGSIDIRVCAPSGTGATGAPAGFSIQWMTKAEFDRVRLARRLRFAISARDLLQGVVLGQCLWVKI
jgi:hypothetical protein